MKHGGMKIGLIVVLVAASGVLFYGQYGPAPKRPAPEYTAEDKAADEADARLREELSKLPGTVTAGS